MVVYDDIYRWKGWGGKLGLASGSCRLRIFDLKMEGQKGLIIIRPIIIIVSDIPNNTMSVRSCAAHIATMVVKEFNIDPQRMIWIEYYPQSEYGKRVIRTIQERFDSVEFTWKGDKAINPRWRPLGLPLIEEVKRIMGRKG